MTQDSFFCVKYELSANVSEKVVETADFDREVIFIRGAGSGVPMFAFHEFTPSGGGGTKDFATWEPSDTADELRFVLPAGQELWTGANVQEVTLSFVVSRK